MLLILGQIIAFRQLYSAPQVFFANYVLIPKNSFSTSSFSLIRNRIMQVMKSRIIKSEIENLRNTHW